MKILRNKGFEEEEKKYLLFNSKRVNITISHIPCKESIRVFAINARSKKEEEQDRTEKPVISHFVSLLKNPLKSSQMRLKQMNKSIRKIFYGAMEDDAEKSWRRI